jgi:hypothetical protein
MAKGKRGRYSPKTTLEKWENFVEYAELSKFDGHDINLDQFSMMHEDKCSDCFALSVGKNWIVQLDKTESFNLGNLKPVCVSCYLDKYRSYKYHKYGNKFVKSVMMMKKNKP